MIGKIKRFNSFGNEEYKAATKFLAAVLYEDDVPLSGYLAGRERGGFHVTALEDAWAKTFHVKHAIACNSATSGLMAAAFAVGLKSGDQFLCPAMTMSATVAAPMFTGATPYFGDISDEDFGLKPPPMPEEARAIFTTNLFGHASALGRNEWDKGCGVYLIEDNAQSPFAMAHGRYVGTMGHIGVWSLNVHKPIQCGEGGMITTDDDDLARRLRDFINHGENGAKNIGLNLRMPEMCAVIALMQLRRGPEIVASRVKQAKVIINAIGTIPGIRPPLVRDGCTHAFYTIPFLVEDRRAEFCAALRDEGVPVVEGYVQPLYRMPAFERYARQRADRRAYCPTAEGLHDRRLFYIENCAYDFTSEQIEQIGEAFRKAARLAL